MYGSSILCKWLPQLFLEKITSINENIFSFFYKRRPPRAFPFVTFNLYKCENEFTAYVWVKYAEKKSQVDSSSSLWFNANILTHQQKYEVIL